MIQIRDADRKIPDASDLAKKTDLNAKITETEGKIPSMTGLVTNSALTTVENEIPDDSSLVKKEDYNTKISEMENMVNDHDHDKYITNPEFNTLAARVFNARLAQANLITKKILILSFKILVKGLPQIKQNTCLLKLN